MIERYTTPVMRELWSEQTKFQTWLEVELLACDAHAKLGSIPARDLKEIRGKAAFSVPRILQIEQETKHDVIAFLTAVAENIGPSSRYVHMGLTSSDVIDTALSVQMVRGADILIDGAKKLADVLRKQAVAHKGTVMMGRSHGVHAEPITFGLKMALYWQETLRAIDRLKRAREVVRVGKISGAVGTHANVDPRVEQHVCRKLGLEPAPVSTQILQRDRHAEYVVQIALVGASLEKFALEVRNLQRTELLEAEEYFDEGQKGSSAMPHKRNPITCERLCGLARVLRGNAQAAMENVALWHERDITHSSAERVIIPDSVTLLDYMLKLAIGVFSRLLVYPKNMRANMEKTRGLIYSQQVLLRLTGRGIAREKAYKMVQRNAMKVWRDGQDFRTLLGKDREVASVLSKKDLEGCFDTDYPLRNVDDTYRRLGLRK